MDEEMVREIVDELLSSLEPLETKSVAILQFMKAKGLATDEELAPFLEQAGNASSVRWRAVRVRTAALISKAMKPSEQPAEGTSQTKSEPPTEGKQEKKEKTETKNEDPKKETGTKKEGAENADREEAAKQEATNQKESDGKGATVEKKKTETDSQLAKQTNDAAKPKSAEPENNSDSSQNRPQPPKKVTKEKVA